MSTHLMWGKKDPKPIHEMATEHLLNALSQIDVRRTELTRELAELNVKAVAMKQIVERRRKREKELAN